MNIEEKLKSILEGTFMGEIALTHSETDELYKLKDELKAEKNSLLIAKDPTERSRRKVKIDELEHRIQEFRNKLFTRA